ncbi:copper chaperone PCu(A)C [Paracidovorax oryzae]|uniref:copper chaperone PCu(A)C n=1 Tax=Paracidovorax oryzae TaxID=862720 RepID=UPI00047A82A7|nr:copper chaperone PCu(A)C [Paracidovorax oryzae]
MKRILSSSLVAIAALASLAAHGQTATVQDAWVRATVPQQKATGAFMKITAAKPMKLVGVKSPAAPVAEIHEMQLQDNVMKMRAVEKLDLPAGQAVELKPGGYHVMLMDLARPVKAGDTVPLQLVLEGADGQRQTVDVQASVRALGTTGANAPAQDAPAHAGHGAHQH